MSKWQLRPGAPGEAHRIVEGGSDIILVLPTGERSIEVMNRARLVLSSPQLFGVLKRLSEKVKRAIEIELSGGRLEAEDWTELQNQQKEAKELVQ